MPSFNEKVESYRATFVRGNQTGSTRFIQLNLATFPGSVVLRFAPDAATNSVGELTKVKGQQNNTVYKVRMNLPLSDYADYIDMLRHEQPIAVDFVYLVEPELGQHVPVENCRLFNAGSEPPGEGDTDTSAALP